MKYDFDEIIPRRGTNSYKWDSAGDADIYFISNQKDENVSLFIIIFRFDDDHIVY